MFRWMCSNTTRHKVRNKNIQVKIGVVSSEKKMRDNQLRWFDHVQRRSKRTY